MQVQSTYTRTLPTIFADDWYGKNQILKMPGNFLAPFWFEIISVNTEDIRKFLNIHIRPQYELLDAFNMSNHELFRAINALETNVIEPSIFSFGKLVNATDLDMDNLVFIPNSGGIKIYGHWLLDILPSLIAVQNLIGRKLPIYLDESLPLWANDLVASFGLKCVNEIKGNVSAVICGLPRRHDYLNSDIFAMYRSHLGLLPDKIHATVTSENQFQKGRSIFVSRSNLGKSHRLLKNSTEVVKFFEKAGFEVLFPEQLTISEQIKLFGQVSILAGEAGSGLHNSIFCSKDTKVINLQSSRQSHFIQSSLCGNFNQESLYIFGKTDSNDWSSNYEIDLRHCEGALSSL